MKVIGNGVGVDEITGDGDSSGTSIRGLCEGDAADGEGEIGVAFPAGGSEVAGAGDAAGGCWVQPANRTPIISKKQIVSFRMD